MQTMSHHVKWNAWPVCFSCEGVRVQLCVSWPGRRNKILGVTFPSCVSEQHHSAHVCKIIIYQEYKGHLFFFCLIFLPKALLPNNPLYKRSPYFIP